MQINIELPDAFAEHYGMDRFHDSLMRVVGDLKSIDKTELLSGNYEVELIEALVPAFDSSTATVGDKTVEVRGMPGGISTEEDYRNRKAAMKAVQEQCMDEVASVSDPFGQLTGYINPTFTDFKPCSDDSANMNHTTIIQRIGTSEFFFNVWYRITNEKALVPIGHCGSGWDMDNDSRPSTYLVGDYSREKFNSVKFVLDIWKQHSFWNENPPTYEVDVHCFVDTRDTGAETIVSYTTHDISKIDRRLYDYAAEVLRQSGAVVNVEMTKDAVRQLNEEIEGNQAVVRDLNWLIRTTQQ